MCVPIHIYIYIYIYICIYVYIYIYIYGPTLENLTLPTNGNRGGTRATKTIETCFRGALVMEAGCRNHRDPKSMLSRSSCDGNWV